MKLTSDQLARGLAASYRLRDSGDPAAGLKPSSFTASPSAHVRVIGEAVLQIDQAMIERAACALCRVEGDDPYAAVTTYRNGIDESWPRWRDFEAEAEAALAAALGNGNG